MHASKMIGIGIGIGILNRMYEAELRANGPLINDFNSKPYKPFSETAAIAQFHGPKLSDYTHFARTILVVLVISAN